jgi:predicted lysophospholipase L1 biosynthesis ABC-type transport system permease subunit
VLERLRQSLRILPRPIRWIVVATVGCALVVAGVVFLVLPGPGLPLILLGLLVLATEFAWAEATLHRLRRGSSSATGLVRQAATRILRRPDQGDSDAKMRG